MKARITSLFFVAMLFSTIAFAQPKNVARLGLFSFATGQFNVSYERVLGDNASVGLYAGYVYKGLGAAFDAVVDLAELGPEYALEPFRGIVLHPEFRLYSAKNGAPKGFYFAPYGRFVSTSSKSSYTWTPTDPSGNGFVMPPSLLDADIRYQHLAFGFQLGHQFLIKDMVAVDFFWFGPRLIGQNKYSIELSGNIANNPNAPVQLGFDDLLGPLGEIEGNVPGIPEALLSAETSATATSATFEMKHVVAILPIRFGLSIGYAF